MNWLKKTFLFREKIKKLLKKRPTKEEIESSDWASCCKGPILKKDLEDNLFCCPSCNKHHRINCRQRFDIVFGKNNYEILETPIPQDDPLNWKDAKTYKERLKVARNKTGQECAVMIVKTKINNIDITAGAFDFAFIGASVGAAEGEAIIYGIQHAIDNQTPFVLFTSGGGMRMFESLIALSQMTRTTLAINELKKNNLPYLVCLTDPTAGGITASFAMLGDINISEPGALIAFAGPRVVKDTTGQDLPEGFQTSEFLLEKGFLDFISDRKNLKKNINHYIDLIQNNTLRNYI